MKRKSNKEMKYLIIGILIMLAYAACLNQVKQVPKHKDLFTKMNVQEFTKGIGNTVVELSQEKLDSIMANQSNSIALNIPYQDTMIGLNLKKQVPFAQDFKVMSTQGTEDYKKGLYYFGTVIGDNQSTVSLSFDSDNINGIISSSIFGTISIIKIKTQKIQYLIYNHKSEQAQMPFSCLTEDKMGIIKPDLQKLKKGDKKTVTNPTKCFTEDLELTYDTYLNFNNVQSATNWIMSLAAVKKTLFANEGWTYNVKSVYVNTQADGYSTNAATALTQVAAKRTGDPNFKGSLVQLVRGKTGGPMQGIAYVGGLCNNYRYSYAEPTYQYNAYPAYSWSANVITHETGHNLGSAHTQSCTWPGGALDNCYATEGGCPPGPPPINGGTIMSYCHLTPYGMNFANGFGPKPHALIDNNLINLTCLDCGTNPATPTCNDGIKNGDETGIDCGGSCKPCAVIDPSTNIALSAKAFQSSEYGGYPASNAIDGRMNTFNHTNAEPTPWLYLDFGSIKDIKNVKVYARQDCCNGRIRNLKVWAFTDMLPIIGDYNQPSPVFSQTGYLQPNQSLDIPVNAKARYIKIQCQALSGATYLHVGELEVYPNSGSVICKDSTITSIVKVTKDSLVYSTIKVCK